MNRSIETSRNGSWRVALVALWLLGATSAYGAPITFAYQGIPYTIIGSSFPGLNVFGSTDQMTGTATINFVGAGTYQASSWSLTSTTTGNVALTPSFTISNSTPGLTAVVNSFTLDATGSIVAWDLGASASLNGNPEVDRLETTPGGDQAVNWSQIGFNLRSVASSTVPGTWSAVPEPMSITLFATGIVMVGLATRRKRRN